MSPGKVSLVCATATVALALPSVASAQIDPGVNYDPGSPAGKEYAIPLVEGRSEGAGTTDQQEGANVPFGVGIEPPGGGPGKRDKPANGRNDRADRAEGPSRSGGGENPEDLAARIAEAEQPAGTAARTFLLALAVLLPAGLLTLILWQRPQVSRTGRTA
jgi:hypothetical protein